ncbi:MAG: SDR family oxidoreductase [Cytophagales bacterium]|nr:SDR family oxidoreductase [Cytophagales bacterium]
MELAGKNALVTGGSRGIGRAIVLELARYGAHVLFTYQSNEAAAKEVEQATGALPGKAVGLRADITQLADLRKAFDAIPAHFGGPPDIFVSSAFSRSVFAPTAFMREEDYDLMFAAVKGHYFALQLAAGQVADGGRIVVLSSGASQMPGVASGAYGGAKAAIERFAFGLSKELGSRQVTVNVVSPGVTDTDGLVAPKEMIDGLVAQTPLGRLGQPEDVARAVLLLCTREAAWVTGQNLGANGGIL